MQVTHVFSLVEHGTGTIERGSDSNLKTASLIENIEWRNKHTLMSSTDDHALPFCLPCAIHAIWFVRRGDESSGAAELAFFHSFIHLRCLFRREHTLSSCVINYWQGEEQVEWWTHSLNILGERLIQQRLSRCPRTEQHHIRRLFVYLKLIAIGKRPNSTRSMNPFEGNEAWSAVLHTAPQYSSISLDLCESSFSRCLVKVFSSMWW